MYLVKMKVVLWLGLSVCVGIVPLLSQQLSINIQPKQIDKEINVNKLDIDFEEISVISVTNTGERSLRLAFDPHFLTEPGGWSLIFRPKPKGGGTYPYSPVALKASSTDAVLLDVGETLDFYLIFQPNALVGEGRLQIPFYEESRPSQTLAVAKFSFKVNHNESPPSSVNKPKKLRIFPNPAVDYFFVESPANTKVGKVEVFNTLGRKLKTFLQPPKGKEGYNIEGLPEGIYLISIYDTAGKKLSTFRLLHRRFGA